MSGKYLMSLSIISSFIAKVFKVSEDKEFPYLYPTVMLMKGRTWERVGTLVLAYPKLPYLAQSGISLV